MAMAFAPAMRVHAVAKRGLVSVSVWPKGRPFMGAGFFVSRRLVTVFADRRNRTWARIWLFHRGSK
jgi:hypothetical protein